MYLYHFTSKESLIKIIEGQSLRATHYTEIPKGLNNEFEIGKNYIRKNIPLLGEILSKAIRHPHVTCFSERLNQKMFETFGTCSLVLKKNKFIQFFRSEEFYHAQFPVNYEEPPLDKDLVRRVNKYAEDVSFYGKNYRLNKNYSSVILKTIISCKSDKHRDENEYRFIKPEDKKIPNNDVFLGPKFLECIDHICVGPAENQREIINDLNIFLKNQGITIAIKTYD